MLHRGPGMAPGPLIMPYVSPANCQVLRVGLPGLEPGTSSLSEKRSNRLSYRPSMAESPTGPLYNTRGLRTRRGLARSLARRGRIEGTWGAK